MKSAQARVSVQPGFEGFRRRGVVYGQYQRIPLIDDAHAERISSVSGDGLVFEEFSHVLKGVECS